MTSYVKSVHCNGCFRKCQITARGTRVLYQDCCIGSEYQPKIGSRVITSYSLKNGKILKPVFSYPVDAVVFARDVLCKKCKNYKSR